MSYRGCVRNGTVVFREPVPLPEGTEVEVELVRESSDASDSSCARSLLERLRPFVGAAKGLPTDLARNHDHYLHGRPKK